MGHHRKRFNITSVTKPLASVGNSVFHTGSGLIKNSVNQPENLVKSLAQNSSGLLPILLVGGAVLIIFVSMKK